MSAAFRFGAAVVLALHGTIQAAKKAHWQCALRASLPLLQDYPSPDISCRTDCSPASMAVIRFAIMSESAGKEITARLRADVDVRPGQSFAFALNIEKAVVFDPQAG